MKKNSAILALSIIVWVIVWWAVMLAVTIGVFKCTGNVRLTMIVAFALLFMNVHVLTIQAVLLRYDSEKHREEL